MANTQGVILYYYYLQRSLRKNSDIKTTIESVKWCFAEEEEEEEKMFNKNHYNLGKKYVAIPYVYAARPRKYS